jgi:hypothetical protein
MPRHDSAAPTPARLSGSAPAQGGSGGGRDCVWVPVHTHWALSKRGENRVVPLEGLLSILDHWPLPGTVLDKRMKAIPKGKEVLLHVHAWCESYSKCLLRCEKPRVLQKGVILGVSVQWRLKRVGGPHGERVWLSNRRSDLTSFFRFGSTPFSLARFSKRVSFCGSVIAVFGPQ